MKKIISSLLIAASTFMTVACVGTKHNPLMKGFETPNGTPTYSQIKNEHYYPAFVDAIEKSKKEIDAIANSSDEPTFQNTIEAMEFGGKDLSRIAGVFFNMLGSNTNDTLQQISMKVSPMLTELGNYSSMNEKLFQRIKKVYETMDEAGLNDIQRRLTTNYYKSFARSGANLSADDKIKYGELTKKSSELSLKFGQNELAATNDFFIELTEEDTKELPSYVVEMAAADAKAKDKEGWIITLQGPSYGSFMQYSTNRTLKEKIWRARATMCIGGKYDNTKVINELVNTRIDIAKVLGYNTYADYVLEENMAASAQTVNDFLANLAEKSLPYAKKDIAELQKFAKTKGANFELMPWDCSYYTNELMKEKYSISDELLKPYFKLENVRDGIFTLVGKLYGIKFVANTTAEPYHKDVMIYDVVDSDGKLLTVLYMDFFPRASKNGGAWMNSIRDQRIENGVEQRPLTTIVCNFTKPTETTPSLLTFDEVTTFLHEFGHAIHGTFATGAYPSLSGTSVSRDFVELPSQIMENWACEKEFLQLFAKHYETGETIPEELIKKIVDAKNFQAGYANTRQLAYAMTDMAWHSLSEKGEFNVEEFEKEARKSVEILAHQKGTAMSPAFGHIFDGGYAAGYYGYKWAEVLEADAFQVFKQNGIFDRATGMKFRNEILSKGGTKDPMELYMNFTGHKPDVNALFVKYGMQ